jgi:hypothetical protein
MLRDVFYYGKKPNVHPREKFAKDLADARNQSTTEHFWIINEFSDYRNFDWDFDFDFLPDEDVWAEDHINVWPSQHQKDSGTWLVNTDNQNPCIIYRNDVDCVKRTKLKSDNWVIPYPIDEKLFDFSWHPDTTDPPFIYQFSSQWRKTGGPRYIVPGATVIKFVDTQLATAVPDWDNWVIHKPIDEKLFDFTWMPDEHEPPYIYVWGNKWVSGAISPTVEYRAPGATEKKYMSDTVRLIPKYDKWVINDPINLDLFDFSWIPDPTSPAYIYVWGNKWVPAELHSTIEYHVDGAIDKKYMNDPAPVLPQTELWKIYSEVKNFDFTWRPDPREPAYIYTWGNKFVSAEISPTLEYHTPGATERKYMGDVEVVPEYNKWIVYQKNTFDLTWRPDPREPAYVYVWGNKYIPGEIKPTLEYHTPGATERKYMGDVEVLPETDKWKIHHLVTNFDLAWRPDPREPAYVYVWGNKYIPGEIQPTIEYYVEGATERKYMGDVDVVPELEKWIMHIPVDKTQFDMAWRPDPREPAYIYTWGNKYVSAELKPTLEYVVPGATDRKYMGEVPVLPNWDNYKIHASIQNFDFTWIPDPREPAYIYTWGNKHVPAEVHPTLEYYVDGATERKYMGNVEVLPELDKWEIHQQIDKEKFDFSWRPNPTSPPYIYVWGNKYIPGELRPTVEYHTPGATEYKYMGNVEVLPEHDRWVEHQQIDKSKFDFAWRPDPREPAYIYTWGNKWIKAELKPTLEYKAPNATERKYMGDIEVLPELSKWKEIQPIDKAKFDLSWRPDPREPAYIYVWGNKWIRPELKSTLEYHMEGATEYKYIQEPVDILPEYDRWKEVQKVTNFDFTWRPDPREPAYIYVWGNKWIPGELKSTIEYHCDGATEIKYMGNTDVLPEYDRYNILIPIDKDSFDFTWRPDPREPAYIYVWGNQSNNAETEPTIEYHCEGASERKYMNDRFAKTLPDMDNWSVLIPVEDFDFSWRPEPGSPPYIYVFGNQWHDAMTEPTVLYTVHGATDKKYITNIIAKVSKTQQYWKTLIDIESFDYSWRPNPHSPPYIYVFGNQWNDALQEPTVEYHCPGATEYTYIDNIKALVKSTATENHWKKLLPIESFDFSWRPDPKSPPYIYVFGNKWNDASTEPTVEYHVEGATDKKYMLEPVAVPAAQLNLWSVNNTDDLETFDFTWRPNPHSPPQIYQWANNGPRYTVPGATEVVLMERSNESKKTTVNKYYITTTLEDLINQHPEEVFWALNPDLNYDKFDFSWRPTEQNFRHINVFGNEYSKNTQTYYINAPLYLLGYKEYNYVEEHQVQTDTNLSMFFIDKGNLESNIRFNKLKELYPKLQKTRFFNNWVETIARCIRKTETKLFWVLNSELDYSDFTFDFYPSPWQIKMIHVFGTQWNHWGNTYVINSETFLEDTKYVKVIEHLNTINLVKSKRAKATDCLYDVYLIDHGNYESVDIIYDITEKIGNRKLHTIDFVDTYHKTFEKILNLLEDKKDQFIWVCNSICHYDKFDFSYICDPFAQEQLHVFPSDRQKYGDTFLVNVELLRKFINDISSLENYPSINFNEHQSVTRINPPEFITSDSHVGSIDKNFKFPYAVFKTNDHRNINIKDEKPISLWSESSKTILVTTTGGTRIIVPKDAIKYVKEELYDYPYIKKSYKPLQSNPLDIVFLSNGESNAEENYEHLLKVTKGKKNKVVRVDGVNGRVNAYHAAANVSTTPWFFTVFAKLKVDDNFDWNWQPDRLQKSKHYIFHATNPVNGLVYGHQAMIAYNKIMTLNNTGKGLDFTLDDNHEVVEINSGTAMFNTDPYSTWRTAFREVIKLCNDEQDYMSQTRLHTWLAKAEGDFSEYALMGANDAYEYYENNKDDFAKLKLTYEWEWLNQYFTNKYKS